MPLVDSWSAKEKSRVRCATEFVTRAGTPYGALVLSRGMKRTPSRTAPCSMPDSVSYQKCYRVPGVCQRSRGRVQSTGRHLGSRAREPQRPRLFEKPELHRMISAAGSRLQKARSLQSSHFSISVRAYARSLQASGRSEGLCDRPAAFGRYCQGRGAPWSGYIRSCRGPQN